VDQAADNYARIWTGGRNFLLRESLGTLEAHRFQRVRAAHRRALVRVESVQRLTMTDAGETVAILVRSEFWFHGAGVPPLQRRCARGADLPAYRRQSIDSA
jgi:hypothetical protein